MRILIEALGIDNPGGGRTATINLLENIFKLDLSNSYTVILSKHEPILERFTNVSQVIMSLHNRFLARFWAQLIIPTRFRNVDLVHFTKNLGVFGLKCPSIITIHDLTVLIYPQFSPWIDVLYWKTVERWSIHAAKLIIAVSKNTAIDVEKFYGKDPNSIKVIYHGKSEKLSPATAQEIQRVKTKYNLPENYIITVGRIDVKKNLTNLVKALSMLHSKISPEYQLILVGEVYKKCEDTALLPAIEALKLQNNVRFLGRVPDEDLPPLYTGAQVCAFPSLHEGFGLVGLEAMACGVPIITHNSSAIVEVVGDAGIQVDSSDGSALAQALESVLTNHQLRQKMIKAGIERADIFNWHNTAQQTLDAYNQVLIHEPK
jgi:glycosyltransferase involved in cell wall biosynthesis